MGPETLKAGSPSEIAQLSPLATPLYLLAKGPSGLNASSDEEPTTS